MKSARRKNGAKRTQFRVKIIPECFGLASSLRIITYLGSSTNNGGHSRRPAELPWFLEWIFHGIFSCFVLQSMKFVGSVISAIRGICFRKSCCMLFNLKMREKRRKRWREKKHTHKSLKMNNLTVNGTWQLISCQFQFDYYYCWLCCH